MVEYTFKEHYTVDDFREIVAILRHPGGCPWDMVQDHHSIRRDLIEETCELAEAIDNDDTDLMKEELGDVLMQVLMHASMEEDAGHFDINDVADAVAKKMIFRHPHVFGEVKVKDVEEELNNWDELKRQEKSQTTYTDTLNAVARTLPALWRAEKIQKKAGKANFVWPNLEQAMNKLHEEESELDAAVTEGDKAHITEEIGDLLYAAVNVARFCGVDPEAALHGSCEKFIRRFADTEAALEGDMKDYSLEEQMAAYLSAKAKEKGHE